MMRMPIKDTPIPDAPVVDIIDAETALKKTRDSIIRDYRETIKEIGDLILNAVVAKNFRITYDASKLKMTYDEFHTITDYLQHFFGYSVWEINGEIWEISWNKDD